MNTLQKSRAHLALTPEQRAGLKLFYMGIVSCGITALTAAVSVLAAHNSGNTVDWSTVLVAAVSTFGSTFVEAFRKWVSAHLDGEVSAALDVLHQVKQSAQ